MEADHDCKGRPISKLITEAGKKVKSIFGTNSIDEEAKYKRPASKPVETSTKPLVQPQRPTPSTSNDSSSPEATEKCPVCDKTFSDISKLIEHSETHFSAPRPSSMTETEQCPI